MVICLYHHVRSMPIRFLRMHSQETEEHRQLLFTARMPNRIFSLEKNRELSPSEAWVGSIRRRLSDPLGRKKQVATKLPIPKPLRVSDPLIICGA